MKNETKTEKTENREIVMNKQIIEIRNLEKAHNLKYIDLIQGAQGGLYWKFSNIETGKSIKVQHLDEVSYNRNVTHNNTRK